MFPLNPHQKASVLRNLAGKMRSPTGTMNTFQSAKSAGPKLSNNIGVSKISAEPSARLQRKVNPDYAPHRAFDLSKKLY